MKHKNLEIIFQHGKPYGIRDSGGYLLFFPTVSKYTGQQERYKKELAEQVELANKVMAGIKVE